MFHMRGVMVSTIQSVACPRNVNFLPQTSPPRSIEVHHGPCTLDFQPGQSSKQHFYCKTKQRTRWSSLLYWWSSSSCTSCALALWSVHNGRSLQPADGTFYLHSQTQMNIISVHHIAIFRRSASFMPFLYFWGEYLYLPFIHFVNLTIIVTVNHQHCHLRWCILINAL